MSATRNVPAIAGLFLKHCLRSRLVLAVVLLVAAIVVIVPAYVEGDGTPDGRVRIVLFYTLGLVALVLSVVSLWTACAAIPTELETRRLHLVLSKPVRRAEVWAGTWLGLLYLNALLLGFASTVIYLQVQRVVVETTRGGAEAPTLAGRRLTDPAETVTADDVQAEIDLRRQKGQIAGTIADRDVFSTIEYELKLRSQTVDKGETRRWEFQLPHPPGREGHMEIRFKFSSAGMDDVPRTGVWRAGTASQPALHSEAGAWAPFQYQYVRIPRAQMESTIVVEFENPLLAHGGAVVFEVDDGIVLLNRESGFLSNFFRAVFVVFLELAFLAALGLSAGSLFSQPVAVFASYAILIMAGLAQYLGISITEDPTHPVLYEPLPVPGLTAFIENVARVSHAVTRPVTQFNVLSRMSQGILVPWSLVGSALIILAGLYSLVLAALGIAIFHRREIGLPRI